MSDPTPLRALPDLVGTEALASQDLAELAAEHADWPSDRRALVYWAVRGQAAAARRRERRVLRSLGLGCAAAAALVALVALAPVAADLFGLQRFLGAEPPSTGAPETAGGLAAPPLPDNTGWTRLNRPDLGVLETSPLAAFGLEETPTERRLDLRSGALRAHILPQDPARPVVVVTPHLRVRVLGTRFDVLVAEDKTLVALLSGEVLVESTGGSALLAPGDVVSSDDPRLHPPPAAPDSARPHTATDAPAARPRAPRASRSSELLARCERAASAPARWQCFERVARGHDLAAESALFNLSALALESSGDASRALALLAEHQRRFPQGALVAEAALRELQLLVQLERHEEAIASAERFARRFPDDPRAPQVALVRAVALCALESRRAEAWSALEPLLHAPEAGVRKAARDLRVRCPPPPAESRAWEHPTPARGPPGTAGD